MERKGRSFTPEYKAEVIGLIRDGGKAASSVARDLGLTESAVRRWVLQSETDAGRGDGKILTTAERGELSQPQAIKFRPVLQRPVEPPTAFFAKEST